MNKPQHYTTAVAIHALPFYLTAGSVYYPTYRKTCERIKKIRPLFPPETVSPVELGKVFRSII